MKEYTLSNEDIKFPNLLDEELDSWLRKENMTKEKLVSILTELISNFGNIIGSLFEITKNDKNNFASLCLKYNVNAYDLIIMLKLNKELAIVVLSKFEQNSNETNIPTFEDFFPKEKKDDNKYIF